MFPVHAQDRLKNLEFKQFSTPDGLPNSMVHQVYQDRDGYIWIPTFYGLFRYDGYEVRTYKSNLYTPGLLTNNNVLCIEEDYSHRLWIGTHEGLCVLDKQTGQMRKMQLEGINKHRLNEIHVTKENKVYLGYIRGMAYYDAGQDTLVLMTHKNCKGEVPEQKNVQTILEDENGDLLIGTWQDGLYRYHIKENKFTHYPPLSENNSVLSLFQDSRGVLWVGTSGYGLYKVNFSSDKQTLSIEKNYRYDPLNISSIPSDYIYSIHEDLQTHSLWLGSRDGIEAEEKSVIDRCLPLVYQNYFSDPKPENMPILGDLYDCLRKQKEPQAQRIATALEIYVNGSLKVFNHQTNVELNNRIVCFDIKELGKQLKKLGMLIIQDQVWNRVTVNRGVKSTWYYIDEFHLLLKEEQTASYSVEIFKRFRKWQGIPTGITQNIKDLLASREIENILDNSDFILMLNQAAGDRQILAKQLNISPYQLSYVTNSGEGEGLLFYGTTIIPFKDKFDKSLKLYSLMTTKPEEVEQREKEGGGNLGRERTERKRESCK